MSTGSLAKNYLMARLEIRDPDDRTTRTLRVSADGQIETEPVDTAWESELLGLSVVDPRDDPRVRLTPEDGDRWLYGLQVNYRGIYFRGVYIDE